MTFDLINLNDALKLLLPALLAFFGVIMGNVLSYKNSYKLFVKQKRFENQRISFARIVSLKIPLNQAMRTFLEAKSLSEYYYRRYSISPENEEDLIQAKKEKDRALALTPEITKVTREVFETLGLIMTCYNIDAELQLAIDNMFSFETLRIENYPEEMNSLGFLEEFQDGLRDYFDIRLKEIYDDKLDYLAKLLRFRMD